MSSKKKKLLFLVNEAEFFLSHWSDLAIAALNEGYEIHVATRASVSVKKVQGLGLVHHEIQMSRSGQNVFCELITLIRLFFLIKMIQPTTMHLITIKPVIYGSLLSVFFRQLAVVCTISGLGTVFIKNSAVGKMRQFFVRALYKLSLNQKRIVVVFENSHDKEIFVKNAPKNVRLWHVYSIISFYDLLWSCKILWLHLFSHSRSCFETFNKEKRL